MPNPGDPIWATTVGYSRADQAAQVARVLSDKMVFVGALNPYGLPSASFDVVSMSGGTNTLQPAWIDLFGAPTKQYAFNDVAVDTDGNMVLTGAFSGTVNFNNGNPANDLHSNGNSSVFIVKLTSSGVHLWSKSFGGSDSGIYPTQNGFGVAVDPNDKSVVVTGDFVGSFTLSLFGGGTATLSTSALKALFIIKLDTSGNYLWANAYSSSNAAGKAIGNGAAIDSSSNVYVTGSIYQSTNLGGSDLTPPVNVTDIFVAKYNSSGNHTWSICYGSTSYNPVYTPNNYGNRVRADSLGNLYVCGQFTGTVPFDAVTKTAPGPLSAFLLKLDPSLHTAIWVNVFGGGGFTGCSALDISPNQNPPDVVVGGSFAGVMSMGGPTPLTSTGYTDGYMARYASDGTWVWQDHYGVSNNAALVSGAAFDTTGSVWVFGVYYGTMTFTGGISITSNGDADWFIAQCGFPSSISPPNPADFTAIVYPSSGTIYTAGVTVSNGSGHVQFNDADSLNSKSLTTGTAVTFYGSPDNTVIPSNINPATTYYVYRITGDDHNFWVTTINPDPSGTTLVNYVDSGTGSTFVRHDQHDWLNPAVSPLQKVGFSFRGAYPSGNTAIYFQFQWLASSTTSALAWPIPPTGTSLFKRTSTDVVYSGGWNWRAAFVPDFTSPAPADSDFCAWQNAKISAMVFNGGTIVNSSAVLFIPHVTTTDYSIGPMQAVAF